MDVEFNTIFAAIGWRNIVPINEPGVKLLTMEFLCTFVGYFKHEQEKRSASA
jgi:hypothetical protein